MGEDVLLLVEILKKKPVVNWRTTQQPALKIML
jgi:hypothetical protein